MARRSPDPPPEPTFEEALERLRQIVDELETGGPPLAEALALYEEGVGKLRRCQELLEGAERRIERLDGVTRAGKPRLTPLDDSGRPVRHGATTGGADGVAADADPDEDVDAEDDPDGDRDDLPF